MTEHPSPLFERLVIVGPGLIGSSILRRAMQKGGVARTLVATDISPQVCARVQELGIAHEVHTAIESAIKDADGVILCIPVGSFAEVAARIGPLLRPGAVLSDVGSTKGSVVEAVAPHLRDDVHFVPVHPMAGTEYSGPDAGFSSLFEGRWCLVTPLPATRPEAVEKVEALWALMGAQLRRMDVALHDRVCAMISHLPHFLSFTICSTAENLMADTGVNVLDFAASGFRDFTRIAASDPVMWRDVFLNNRGPVLEMIERFRHDIDQLAQAIREGDKEFITERITHGRMVRKTLIEKQQA